MQAHLAVFPSAGVLADTLRPQMGPKTSGQTTTKLRTFKPKHVTRPDMSSKLFRICLKEIYMFTTLLGKKGNVTQLTSVFSHFTGLNLMENSISQNTFQVQV